MADRSVDSVVVTGVGCTLAVGDSVHGAAAVRAGLSRPSPTGLVVGTKDDELPVAVKAHSCRGLEGFQGLGRLLAMLRSAAADLRGSDAEESSGAVAVFVHLPDFERRPRVLEQDDRHRQAAALGSQILQRLALPGSEITLHHGDRCAWMASLATAAEWLRAGRVSRCLVVAADSLVEQATLEELYGADRLQTPDNQDGFFAGEAAAIVQLELADTARRQGHRALAALGDPRLEVGRDEAAGVALARVLKNCVPPAAIWSDQNGESWRANDWGHALQRLAAAGWPGIAARLHVSVEGTGELGAASAAVQLVLATRAAARPGAATQLVLVADEDGARAAVTVSPLA